MQARLSFRSILPNNGALIKHQCNKKVHKNSDSILRLFSRRQMAALWSCTASSLLTLPNLRGSSHVLEQKEGFNGACWALICGGSNLIPSFLPKAAKALQSLKPIFHRRSVSFESQTSVFRLVLGQVSLIIAPQGCPILLEPGLRHWKAIAGLAVVSFCDSRILTVNSHLYTD